MITLAKTAVPLHTMKTGEIEVMLKTWSDEALDCLLANDGEGYEQAAGFYFTYLGEFQSRNRRQ